MLYVACRRTKIKKGFNLPEILIILGIISIVSTLTIPNLITSYQKKLTINKLKTEYSKFANVIASSVYENGDTSDWLTKLENGTTLLEKSQLITEKYILPYIDGGGKSFKLYEYGTIYSLGAKEPLFVYYSSGTPYRIKNGTIFKLSIYNDRLILLLDIDNKIKNNRCGKDVFAFEINTTNNRLEPAGNELSRNVLIGIDKYRFCRPPECTSIKYLSGAEACNRNNLDRYSGYYCAALILKDGWKISKDYPW